MTQWDGLSLRWYEFVLADAEVQHDLLNSLIVGIVDRDPRDDRRDDGGARPAARAEVVPASRSTALTYVSVIVPELVIALATLVFFASTIGRDGIDHVGDGRRARVRLPHDRAAP